jgi:hypothetical protein
MFISINASEKAEKVSDSISYFEQGEAYLKKKNYSDEAC